MQKIPYMVNMSTILRLVSSMGLKYDGCISTRLILIGIFIAFLTPLQKGRAQVEFPPNDGFFTTDVDVLSAEDAEKFEIALDTVAQSSNQSVVVLFIDDIYGKDPAEVASSVQKSWNLPNTSVLLLIAYKDRKAVVLPGTQMEQVSPESANGIVEMDVLPNMRAGDYNQAILKGVESILLHLSGTYTDDRYQDVAGVPKSTFVTLLYSTVGLVILAWLFGTVILFATNYTVSLAGTILGLAVGSILLQRYNLWLSIPAFFLVGVCTDIGIHKFYKAVLPGKTSAKRRRRRS